MRRAGRQGMAQALALALSLCACRTASRGAPSAQPARAPNAGLAEPAAAAFAPQPGNVIGDVSGTLLLALEAPQFAQLSRDQRLLAYQVSQAAAAGEAVAVDQSYRHNL